MGSSEKIVDKFDQVIQPDSVVTKRENRKRPCGIPMENDGAVYHRNTHTFSPFANTAPVKGGCKTDNAGSATTRYG